MSMLIQARCDDQVLSYIRKPYIASGDVNVDRISFEFCPKWNGYEKTASFYRDESLIYHVSLEDDACVIPSELMANPGILYVGVFGTLGDKRRTSDIISFTITKGAITDGTAAPSTVLSEIEKMIDESGVLEGAY